MPSPSGSSAAAPAGHAALNGGDHTQEIARLAAAGADLAAEGRYAPAAALFQQALGLEPPPTEAAALQEMLAQCHLAAGKDEEAYRAATSAVQLRPGWRPALLTLGRAARNAGRLREAAAALESCLNGAAAAGGAEPGCSAAGLAVDPALAKGVLGPESEAGPDAAARVESRDDSVGEVEGALQDDELEAAAAARLELGEVRSLLQLQLGHQLGLPGLRVLERHGGATGPGSVVWEAGALLAWFLVQQARGDTASSDSPCAGTQPACCDSLGGAADCTQHAIESSVCGAEASAGGSSGQSPRAPPASSVLRGARVLELGSGGAGLVGIAAACLGAHVVATDLPEVLPQLQAAAALNAGIIAAGGGSLRCAALDWAAPSSDVLAPPGGPPGQFAWLVGADLVYSLRQVQPLVETIAAAAAAAAAAGAPPLRLLIAHKRRHEEADAALLRGLRSAGLALQAVLRDAGSRCTVYASEAAVAALGPPKSSVAR
ncbi:hypothetical protein ABPG77_009329 [Micractinium sp. CCAP 211/92]